MIYSALEQNLHSAMYFYICAMIVVSLVIIAMVMLMLMASKIGGYNLRKSFYYDYIQIIESVIENKNN